jgi:ribosomal protein L11 methyltransferase
MNYYQYRVSAPKHKANTDFNDIIIAELAELPFDTFEEEGDTVLAYMPEKEWSDDVQTVLDDLQTAYGWRAERHFIEQQNWNAVWEANFQPIIVRDFCAVRASFHQPIDDVRFDLVIDPKMAFGTGHHETTYMMMDLMSRYDSEKPFKDAKVFDYGCGTGILAILAAKLGATKVDAVDIEHESYLSTIENAELNVTPEVQSIFGTLDDVNGAGYDYILANINRNVIIPSLSRLYEQADGLIFFSGILERDADLVITAAQQQGFTHLHTEHRADWVAIVMQK